MSNPTTSQQANLPTPTNRTAGGQAYYKKTRALVEFSGQPSGDETAYPREWFTSGNRKPKLIIKFAENTSLESLRSYVFEVLTKGTLTKDLAMWYVYAELSRISEPITEPWTSFGVEIANLERGANPFSPVEVVLVNTALSIPPSTNSCDQYIYWMLVCILSMYRLCRTTYSEYKAKLSNALAGQSEIIRPQNCDSYETLSTRYGTWKDDANYRKLIASVDMFYAKFPGREYSLVRFGTVSSRYKDCAALSALFNLKKTMGMEKENEVSYWIRCEVIADEFIRVTKPDQEVEQADSYFPYLIDFGFTVRSPYSSIVNPNLYFFASTAAFLMGSSRSKNAVYHEINSASSVLMNSVLVGYAFAKRANNEMQFYSSQRDMDFHLKEKGMKDELAVGKESERVADIQEPLTRDSEAWFSYMDQINWDYTEGMKKFCLNAIRNLSNVRETSLGLYNQEPPDVSANR